MLTVLTVNLAFIHFSQQAEKPGNVSLFLTSPWWSALKSSLCQESYKLHIESVGNHLKQLVSLDLLHTSCELVY